MNESSDGNCNIVVRKTMLEYTLEPDNKEYFTNLCIEIVRDCNYLFIQVNYLLKSYVLHECSTNYDKCSNFIFNDVCIRFCFTILRSKDLTDNDLTTKFQKDDVRTKIYKYFITH